MGFRPRPARMMPASSSTPNTEPPGESTSSTTALMAGSAMTARNACPNASAEVPPLMSVIMFVRGAMTPWSGSTATGPPEGAASRDRAAEMRP